MSGLCRVCLLSLQSIGYWNSDVGTVIKGPGIVCSVNSHPACHLFRIEQE